MNYYFDISGAERHARIDRRSENRATVLLTGTRYSLTAAMQYLTRFGYFIIYYVELFTSVRHVSFEYHYCRVYRGQTNHGFSE
jgi:hypothetical protein